MANTEILLSVVNNTPVVQRASLFTNNAVSTSTNTQQYTWNVTSFTFVGQQTVSIQQKIVGASSFTTSIAPITTLTFQGVCDALNTLGFGTFITYTSGSNTYITVYSLTYVFGILDLYNSVNILTLTYNGTSFPVLNPNSVSDWNTYFNTSINSLEPFHSVSVVGTTVNLYGGIGFSLNNISTPSLISDVTNITDNGTVTSVAINGCQGVPLVSVNLPKCITLNTDSFDSCSLLTTVNLPLATNIGYAAFNGCTSLASISLPKAISIGDFGFGICTSLTTIYLPLCLNLGSTVGDNSVFDLISGNIITLTIPLSTSTDADVVYLQTNNTVTLITT